MFHRPVLQILRSETPGAACGRVVRRLPHADPLLVEIVPELQIHTETAGVGKFLPPIRIVEDVGRLAGEAEPVNLMNGKAFGWVAQTLPNCPRSLGEQGARLFALLLPVGTA